MRVLSQSSLYLEGKTGTSCTLIPPTICRRFRKSTYHEILEFSWEKKAGLPLDICGYLDPIMEEILDLGIGALSLGSPSSLKRMIGISQKKIFQVGKTASSFSVLGTRKRYGHWFKNGCSQAGAFIFPLRCEFPHNAPLGGRIFHRIRERRVKKILVRKISAENLLTR